MPPRDPAVSCSARFGVLSRPTTEDPYRYQLGFGNHHVSEAIPGALPKNGTNVPQKCPYDLYAEHLNGTPFVSSRDATLNVWMYRVRPAVAHRPSRPFSRESEIESCFLPTNPDIDFTPLGHTWGPLGIPVSESQNPRTGKNVSFVEGLKTICGQGDPSLKQGLAIHQYAFNADMTRRAFVNHDGDLLMLPQKGSLDIQTELGHLLVHPGALAVIPAGIRFAVRSGPLQRTSSEPPDAPDGESGAAGYALEAFGSHFKLPDLGPLGANGLAHARDFEYPVASFDLDPPAQRTSAPGPRGTEAAPWEIVIKMCGKLHAYEQDHTPFDVVAWHGRYAPYKYELSRFVNLTANRDQLDPTACCVLTVPGASPTSTSCTSLVDLCVFGPKAVVAADSFRLPYHHRTVAAEVGGVIRGPYGGSVRPLEEGGLCFEQAFMPHGENYKAWKRERERTQEEGVGRTAEGYLGFVFHVPAPLALTRYAMERHPDIRLEAEDFWDDLQGHLVDNLNAVNRALDGAGQGRLSRETSVKLRG